MRCHEPTRLLLGLDQGLQRGREVQLAKLGECMQGMGVKGVVRNDYGGDVEIDILPEAQRAR